MQSDNAPLIQQIVFHGDGIEIVYAEPRDVENAAQTNIVRTRVVAAPSHGLEQEIGELVEAGQSLIDRIAFLERRPPDSYRR